MRDLGVGGKQLVEIAKALSKEARVLILDEPTAALPDREVATLLNLVREFRRRGMSCIYVSHKLDEVFAIADRITVLRDGATITTLHSAATTKAEVIRAMVGREITELFPRHTSHPGEMLLTVAGLSVAPARGKPAQLHDISFSVRAGEVLGFGGLMGAGRTELLMHLFGAWGVCVAGTVQVAGRTLELSSPVTALAAGLVLASEDRKRYGLILGKSIGFNLSLSSITRLCRGVFVDEEREAHANQDLFRSLRVKALSLETPVSTLSGGNQQKVVLGKALMTAPRVVFLDEPTRGIDVGAKLEVYALINELTAQGKAVVLVSSELPELMGMSDRIIMLHEGRIGGEFDKLEATPERLLAAAMGRSRPAA